MKYEEKPSLEEVAEWTQYQEEDAGLFGIISWWVVYGSPGVIVLFVLWYLGIIWH